ncbi:MAG TPA: hypothetical protein VIJ93_05520 [bacterium]
MIKSEKAVTFLSLGNQYNQEMLKAAESLVDAKNHLLFAKGDLGGHREEAIQHINSAVDEIRSYEENGNHRR